MKQFKYYLMAAFVGGGTYFCFRNLHRIQFL